MTGRLVRPDTGTGIAGQPVQLYGRRKGTPAWTAGRSRVRNLKVS